MKCCFLELLKKQSENLYWIGNFEFYLQSFWTKLIFGFIKPHNLSLAPHNSFKEKKQKRFHVMYHWVDVLLNCTMSICPIYNKNVSYCANNNEFLIIVVSIYYNYFVIVISINWKAEDGWLSEKTIRHSNDFEYKNLLCYYKKS